MTTRAIAPAPSRVGLPPKADAADLNGRFREIISDPINLLIRRDPGAGTIVDGYVRLHNGIVVSVDAGSAYYGDFSQILILNRGVHEPLEEFVFQEVMRALPAAPFMLELGSYWAHYSMWLLRHRPDATVVMVEPDPINMAAGRSNFKKNGLSGEFIEDIVAAGRFEVDRFRRARGLTKIDILHVDIQGAEVDMLKHCGESLSDRAIDRLFISTHSQELHNEIRHCLDQHGYRIEISSDFDHETTSFDGLVVASSPLVTPTFAAFHPLGRAQIADATPQILLEHLLEIEGQRP